MSNKSKKSLDEITLQEIHLEDRGFSFAKNTPPMPKIKPAKAESVVNKTTTEKK